MYQFETKQNKKEDRKTIWCNCFSSIKSKYNSEANIFFANCLHLTHNAKSMEKWFFFLINSRTLCMRYKNLSKSSKAIEKHDNFLSFQNTVNRLQQMFSTLLLGCLNLLEFVWIILNFRFCFIYCIPFFCHRNTYFPTEILYIWLSTYKCTFYMK